MTYFNLGRVANITFALINCEMGNAALGGPLDTVKSAIFTIKPRKVVMIGIAFGMKPERQNIGQVLVSEQLRRYDGRYRVGSGERGPVILSRDDVPHADSSLLKQMRHAALTWPQGKDVRFGQFLTGEKLIDNAEFRDSLASAYPEAIGGDMESWGIYVACQSANVPWIVVKAICDWADGKKHEDKDNRQELAASNAAQFARHALTFGSGGIDIRKVLALLALVLGVLLIWGWKRFTDAPTTNFAELDWNWAGEGFPSRSEWRVPDRWVLKSVGDRPALEINGDSWEFGGPKRFETERLSNTVVRFKAQFPDGSDSDGTRLVWMVRVQNPGLKHLFAPFFRIPEIDSFGNYQFSLRSERKDWFLDGRFVPHLFGQSRSLGRPRHLGIHCCVASTIYDIAVRVLDGHFDSCVVPVSETDLVKGIPKDPDAGVVGAAYYLESAPYYRGGAFGFAHGASSGSVILTDIEILNLSVGSVRPTSDRRTKYYAEDFKCE